MISLRQNFYLKILRFCVALFLMTLLVFAVGPKELMSTVYKIDLSIAMLAGGCLVSLFLIGSFNIWLLLNMICPISFFSFLKAYMHSWVASLLMPGQVGDVSIVLFLKSSGIPFKHSSIVYLLDKFITMLIFIGVAIYGMYILIPKLYLNTYLFIVPVCFVTILLFVFWYVNFRNTILEKIKNKIKAIFVEFADLFKKKWYILFINVVITIIKWLTTSLGFYFAFLSFGVQVNIVHIAVIPILSTLVGYIPISIAGLGTVEITAVYLFSQIQIEQAIVINSYLLLRVIQYSFAIFLLVFLNFKDVGKQEY